MSLSLDLLQDILRESKAERDSFERENAAFSSRTKPIREAAMEIWQSLTVLPTKDGGDGWIRPIPDNIYTCALSEPQTTLVSWDSLSAKVQAKVAASYVHGQDVVEVPRVYLEADAVESQKNTNPSSSALQKRPLIGNLSNKIIEYTRGVSGKSRPFPAGGLSDETKNDAVNHYLTPGAIESSLNVLREGTEISWKNGNMITAPPGVDFKVGLSLDELVEKKTCIDCLVETTPNTESELLPDLSEPAAAQSISISQPRPAQAGLFTRILFDDDSLFGSSDDSSDDASSTNEDTVASRDESVNEWADPSHEMTQITHPSSSAVDDEQPVSEEDIDNLLQEFVHSNENPLDKKRSKAFVENPLDLAQHQALLQSNTTKKSWASTQLLPIADFNALVPNPAIEFPFTLDDFQQQAIARLERSESVFVAAHTSAGKTVVAEYAVALAKQRATRCVYTSPIKALSNQKFRDFCLKFGAENVGLVTGDLQVNVDDSTCLIMTTEILRSMLYRGADLIRDIEWVIFDEVHYVNDTERGVVWEEVIIMLPSYVNFIFLSATTPNTIEFSDWIGRTKRKVVHVVTTNYRPVPLSHYLWAGHELHLIRQGNGTFLDSGHYEATQALLPPSAREKKVGGKQKPTKPPSGSQNLVWQAQGTKQNWISLVRYLDREFLTPAVVFSFSKKKCEEVAQMLRSLDLCTGKERGVIQGFTMQTVARLSQIDSKLPQVQFLCEMVQRGIAVHHGGLLPILKEMVEILFSRNLIKVLFATETFAMGVNMPAKAVVFNSIRKHDGNQFRALEPGEYTQMAGRAGRRGLDKVGTVIICCFGEQPPPVPILRQLLTGSSTQLRSQFRLTYNMILNLLRVEEMSVESMIKRSFSEFATQRALAANEYPQLLAKGSRVLDKLEKQFREEAAHRFGAEDIEQYFITSQEIIERNRRVIAYISESDPNALETVFQVGRLVVVTAARKHGTVRAPAFILTALKPDGSDGIESQPSFICVALLPAGHHYNGASNVQRGSINYVGSALGRHYKVMKLSIDQVLFLSRERRKFEVSVFLDQRPRARTIQSHASSPGATSRQIADPFFGRKVAGKKNEYPKEVLSAAKEGDSIVETITALVDVEREELDGHGIPTLDLRTFLRRGSDVIYYRQLCDEADDLLSGLRHFGSHRHPNLEKYFTTLERQKMLRNKVETLRHILSNESLQLFPDFLLRKSVLRRLGYVDDNETVCVKGRVACEVNTCEELIVTEMVFEGILNDLKPPEIAAALSALVYQEKKDEQDLEAELPQPLLTCCDKMKKIATNLGQLQKAQGLQVDPKDYCDSSLNFGLVHAVFEWALGVPFRDICELTDAQEGSIVRCITRLDELCREVRNCARVVGNPTLYRKLEDASMAIKRDIVFASSLYVS